MKNLITLRQTTRPWHIPAVAALCIGVPLLAGLYFHQMEAAKLASVGALVILYIQSNDLINRFVTLMICGFGLLFSYAFGSIFSFGYYLPAFFLGLYTFGVHYSLFQLNLTRPPGNFFFVMLAAMAISTPKSIEKMSFGIGNIALGVVVACIIGFVYSLFALKGQQSRERALIIREHRYINMTESIIFGTTIGVSLLIAKLLHMENPYWVPISCTAVMQGISTSHVWERALHRMVGTVVGLGLTWCLLQLPLSIWQVCACIIVLQGFVEFFVVRNYGLAVIFISMLTVLLAEPNIALTEHTNSLVKARLVDTCLGSVVGVIGGWLLYHEKVHFYTQKQLKTTRVYLHRFKRSINRKK